MSDPMNGRPPMGMPPGGAPPGRGAPPPGNAGQAATAIRDNRSVFHPTDMAAMQQTGDVQANMTIAQFFQKFGIDVNRDPVSKLAQFTQDQLSKANPVNKMGAIAGAPGGAPGGGAPAGSPPGAPPPAGGGGLSSLMSGMKG